MKRENITELDAQLAQLRAMMLMTYGGTMLMARSQEEKLEAFLSIVAAGVQVIASAICSRNPHHEALRITLEKFPEMVTDAVNEHLKVMAEVEAQLQRDGATIQ